MAEFRRRKKVCALCAGKEIDYKDPESLKLPPHQKAPGQPWQESKKPGYLRYHLKLKGN